MAWKTRPSKTTMPAKAGETTIENGAKPPEVVNLLNKVARFLQEGNPESALDVISRNRIKSPWVANANGVCLLRLARAKEAVNLFRSIALSPGAVTIRADAPIVFKTNFATALLMHENLGGCLRVLHDINDEQDPTVRQLRAAIQRFRECLTLRKRMLWKMGVPPDGPVPLDFTPGSLE
jgi:hypothetical protein